LFPDRGFQHRSSGIRRLRELIGSRPWAVSEFGYHTSLRPHANWLLGLFGGRQRWTDADVARMVRWEWAFWQSAGAEFATLHRLDDGPSDAALDRYGIRRIDGSLKPVAWTLQPGPGDEP
jgi:hypothetical protein